MKKNTLPYMGKLMRCLTDFSVKDFAKELESLYPEKLNGEPLFHFLVQGLDMFKEMREDMLERVDEGVPTTLPHRKGMIKALVNQSKGFSAFAKAIRYGGVFSLEELLRIRGDSGALDFSRVDAHMDELNRICIGQCRLPLTGGGYDKAISIDRESSPYRAVRNTLIEQFLIVKSGYSSIPANTDELIRLKLGISTHSNNFFECVEAFHLLVHVGLDWLVHRKFSLEKRQIDSILRVIFAYRSCIRDAIWKIMGCLSVIRDLPEQYKLLNKTFAHDGMILLADGEFMDSYTWLNDTIRRHIEQLKTQKAKFYGEAS